jgi:hypothetical protein
VNLRDTYIQWPYTVVQLVGYKHVIIYKMFWLAHDGFIADNRFVQLAAALTTVLLLIFSFWTVFVQVTHVMPVDGLVV